jgi:hypothetical protein
MIVVALVPVVLSSLVLGAHLLRGGHLVLAPAAALLPGLLALRSAWATRALQVVLLVAALEWVRTLLVLVDARHRMGLPFARLALILGAAALVTTASAAILQRRLRA